MKSVDRRSFLALGCALALGACGSSETSETTSAETETSKTDATEGAQEATGPIVNGVLIEPFDNGYSSGLHHATIEVEGVGTIKVELNANNTPITVSNFAELVNEGFYNGLTFHRIMKGFMIQGGDPKGNGTGGSDENIVGEFSANGFTQNTLSHTRGVISMARSSDMNSASSQFFIVHKDSTFLDGQYAAFGEVTDGMDVVDKIATDAKPVDGNGTIPSSKQPVINSVTIERAQ